MWALLKLVKLILGYLIRDPLFSAPWHSNSSNETVPASAIPAVQCCLVQQYSYPQRGGERKKKRLLSLPLYSFSCQSEMILLKISFQADELHDVQLDLSDPWEFQNTRGLVPTIGTVHFSLLQKWRRHTATGRQATVLYWQS